MLLVMRVLSIVPLSFKVRFALHVLSFSLFLASISPPCVHLIGSSMPPPRGHCTAFFHSRFIHTIPFIPTCLGFDVSVFRLLLLCRLSFPSMVG